MVLVKGYSKNTQVKKGHEKSIIENTQKILKKYSGQEEKNIEKSGPQVDPQKKV